MPTDFLEKTLETIIFENYQKLGERGLLLDYRHIDRQFLLPSGKKVDLINWQIDNEVLSIRIIELKKDACSEVALWQLLKYMEEITNHIVGYFKDIKIEGILIGDIILLELYNILLINSGRFKMYTYTYDYDGIKFTHEDHTMDLVLELNRRGCDPMYTESAIPRRLKFQEDFRSGKIKSEETNQI